MTDVRISPNAATIHVEGGIGGSGGGGTMLIGVTDDKEHNWLVLNKTYGEIKTALSNGIVPVILADLSDDPDWERYDYYPICLYEETTSAEYENIFSISAGGGSHTFSFYLNIPSGEDPHDYYDEYPHHYYGD